VPDGALKHDA